MLRLATLLALVGTACAQGGGGGTDGGGMPRDSAVRQDGGRDAGGVRDGGHVVDSGMTLDATVPADGGTAADGGTTPDGGMMTVDSGPRDSGVLTCPATPGSLVIDEVMISSLSGSGDRGEWFEVVNVGACTVGLAGLVIVSPTGAGVEKTHTVAGGMVAPGQYFVFALDAAPAANHFLPFDYAYGTGGAEDVIFNNSADWLELRVGASVIDRVDWPSSGFTHGRSRMLPGTPTVAANDVWANLCDSTTSYSSTGGTFYGTPQMPNGTCM